MYTSERAGQREDEKAEIVRQCEQCEQWESEDNKMSTVLARTIEEEMRARAWAHEG